MQIQLPKWMIEELEKDTEQSMQYIIKEIIREYIDSIEGGIIRERIEKKKKGTDRKSI